MVNHSGIVDGGTAFQIVPSTRKVTVPPAYKVIGTVGEHCAEQLTFACPSLIDGHEIDKCARKYITWKNTNGDVGHDELKKTFEDGSNVYFTWDVSHGLTVANGIVSFSVHFEDVDENGIVIYRWSTTTCRECEILDSINAVLNAYEAIYVAGETLVFVDYNKVEGGTLDLASNGINPDGTLEIKDNGYHDVGVYAQVKVDVDAPTGSMKITQNGTYDVTNYAEAHVALSVDTPQISISEDGRIKSTANGVETVVRLKADHDPDFVPENIREGVNIFGVDGVYKPYAPELVDVTVTRRTLNPTSKSIYAYYTTWDGTKLVDKKAGILVDENSYTLPCLKGSLITFVVDTLFYENEYFHITTNGEIVHKQRHSTGNRQDPTECVSAVAFVDSNGVYFVISDEE